MSVPANLEVYAILSMQDAVKTAIGAVTLNVPGARPQVGAEEWVDFYAVGDARTRARRGVWDGVLVFQVSCVSKLERADKDTMAPARLASLIRAAIEKADVPVRTIGVAPEAIIGVLNVKELRRSYQPRRNITFEGEGNYSVEQGNTHAVVLTWQAVLVVA